MCRELEEIEANYKYKLKWVETLYRSENPVKHEIDVTENFYLDQITKMEGEYLTDYIVSHVLK
ncbi:MAG TPA: hypothetical protein DD638_02625 [Pasteurellaceae bacterium]|nr:hypothetical protein [Pasteurellaceae bacterium]